MHNFQPNLNCSKVPYHFRECAGIIEHAREFRETRDLSFSSYRMYNHRLQNYSVIKYRYKIRFYSLSPQCFKI